MNCLEQLTEINMVRVLLCHYFKDQNVFSDSYQPTAITTTKEYLFLSTSAMKICVYSLEQPNFPLFCQFPTISKPMKLMCNDHAKYVAAIESKVQRSRSSGGNRQTFARVYFNWSQASLGEAVRAVVAGHSKCQKNVESPFTSQFLVVELPLAFSPCGISSCPTTGNIIVAGERRMCLFRACGGPVCYDFELFVEVDPGLTCIRGLAFGDTFLAVMSNLEVRIIKLVFSSAKDAVRSKGKQILSGDMCDVANAR